MSYTPNTWTTGDTITAEKLNNMEQGIASAGGGGGVDAAIVLTETGYDESTDTSTYQAEAKAGTYANLKAKLEDGMPLNIQFVFSQPGGFLPINIQDYYINQLEGNPIEIEAFDVRNLVSGDDTIYRVSWAADNTISLIVQ